VLKNTVIKLLLLCPPPLVLLQVLEVETFIPMVLQRQEDGVARLKRVILIGTHVELYGG
jgi:hypothetical protein